MNVFHRKRIMMRALWRIRLMTVVLCLSLLPGCVVVETGYEVVAGTVKGVYYLTARNRQAHLPRWKIYVQRGSCSAGLGLDAR